MLHSVLSPRRAARPFAGVVATLLTLGLMASPAAAATPPTLTIQDPGTPTAGPVELRGSVSAGSLTTTVLYAVDASLSTQHPDGLDCDGSGAFTPGRDNVNGDNSAGDVLDCEIGAVLSLNSTLATSPGSPLVALETFYGTAAAPVELAPGTATPALTAPGARDVAGQVVVDTRARELRRPDPSVTGTSFDKAVETALATLSSAPAGPKWIIFLSDGQGQVADSTIAALRASGVNLRSFAPGSPGGCQGSLAAMAAATGQDCVEVRAWIQRDDSVIGFPRRGRQSHFDDPAYERFDAWGRPCTEDNKRSYVKRAGTINGLATGTPLALAFAI